MWTWPVPLHADGRQPVVSNPFGMQSNGVMHWGADIMYRKLPSEPAWAPYTEGGYITPPDTPALAANDGVVIMAGPITTGGFVRIDHGDGVWTQYMHLDPVKVSIGQQVKAGDVVGTIGNNPLDSGDPNHLHFEYVVNGDRLDPAGLLASWSYTTPNSKLTNWVLWAAVAAGVYAVWRFT